MSLESRVLREAAYNLSGTDPQETKAVLQMAAAKIDELRAKLAESEQCLQSAIDNNLNKLLAMSDEQVTALTRLEGSNPADVAALARKTMELAAANVKLNECSRLYEAALKREFDLAQKLGALEKQQPTAWMYDWECEGELVKNWMTTDNEEAHSLPNGCHNIRPLFLSAGAAPVCTSDEWLANCPQSVRDLANKIKAGAAPVQQKPAAWTHRSNQGHFIESPPPLRLICRQSTETALLRCLAGHQPPYLLPRQLSCS